MSYRKNAWKFYTIVKIDIWNKRNKNEFSQFFWGGGGQYSVLRFPVPNLGTATFGS